MKKFIVGLIKLSCLCAVVAGCMAEPPLQGNQSDLSNQQTIVDRKKDNSVRYQLVKDGKKELCELNPLLCRFPELCTELEKNFNHFAHEPPMVCGRKFEPSLGFTIPDWQSLPMDETSWNMIKQIYYATYQRIHKDNIDHKWQQEVVRLQGLVDKGQTLLWQATFDIDNKAGKENVILMKNNECDVNQPLEWQPDPSLHVFTAQNKLDDRYDSLNGTLSFYDAFFYQDHTYLSQLYFPVEGSYKIYILDAYKPRHKFGFSTVCIFEFQIEDKLERSE